MNCRPIIAYSTTSMSKVERASEWSCREDNPPVVSFHILPKSESWKRGPTKYTSSVSAGRPRGTMACMGVMAGMMALTWWGYPGVQGLHGGSEPTRPLLFISAELSFQYFSGTTRTWLYHLITEYSKDGASSQGLPGESRFEPQRRAMGMLD